MQKRKLSSLLMKAATKAVEAAGEFNGEYGGHLVETR
jgi:hypothetical protein